MKDIQYFRPIKWADVKMGDQVWLAGTHEGKPCAYGPHMVIGHGRLRNGLGMDFTHLPEELLVRDIRIGDLIATNDQPPVYEVVGRTGDEMMVIERRGHFRSVEFKVWTCEVTSHWRLV